MKLAELHWPEVKELDRKNIVVVVPVGSMEQHGPHLPFQVDVFHDICGSLHHHGFRRIVLLNGHGGNRSSLEVLGQELFVELGLTVNTLAYWDLVPDLVKSLKTTKSSGMGHSGELE